MKSKNMNPKCSFGVWQKFKRLKWFTPSTVLPHGFMGILSVLFGTYLIACSILGDLAPYKSCLGTNVPIILVLYSVFTACNALAGAKLSHLAWKETQMVFRQCAYLQLCLSFYILRFAPIFNQIISAIQSKQGNLESEIVMHCIRFVDVLLSIVLVFCILSFQQVAYTQWVVHKKISIALAVSIGSIGMLLLSTYPIQLAIGGHEWWTCIQETYPQQNVGMVGYIYLPATVTFSLILFSATLYQRGIISEFQFGIGAATTTLVCLVATVLSQELHIPFVSTQRIYLPCKEPIANSTEAHILHALDFSIYARSFWREIFGVHINKH